MTSTSSGATRSMIVRGCLAFRRGDSLIEMVNLGHRDLAVAVAEAAYRRAP